MYHVFALAAEVEKSFGEKWYYSTDFFCGFVYICGFFPFSLKKKSLPLIEITKVEFRDLAPD